MATFYAKQEELDDELFATYNGIESDDERYGEDDSESLGSIIDSGMRTVGNIVSGGIGNAMNPIGAVMGGIGQVLGVNPSSVSTAGIQAASNLLGSIQTSNGRQIPFKLPSSIATKQDIDVLRGAISKINTEIKSVADAGNTNATALTRLTKEVKAVDGKHGLATRTQNKYISRLGRSVDKLGKDLKETRNQAQMQMMMSLLIQPEIKSLQFNPAAELKVGVPIAVDKTEMKDENNMLMMMMMMGGFGGDSGGGGDMMSNPLMMMLMMKGFN